MHCYANLMFSGVYAGFVKGGLGFPWRAREREPITGVCGGAPSGGPGGRAPGGGQGGEAPLKLMAFSRIYVWRSGQIGSILCVWEKTAKKLFYNTMNSQLDLFQANQITPL